MKHADPLKGQAIPGVLSWRVKRMAPISAVCNGGVAKGKIENGEEVHQAIQAGIFLAANAVVADQVAIHKIFHHVGQVLAGRTMR